MPRRLANRDDAHRSDSLDQELLGAEKDHLRRQQDARLPGQAGSLTSDRNWREITASRKRRAAGGAMGFSNGNR